MPSKVARSSRTAEGCGNIDLVPAMAETRIRIAYSASPATRVTEAPGEPELMRATGSCPFVS